MAYYSYPGEFLHGTNIIIDNIIVFLDFMKSSYPVFPTIPPPQNIVHIMTQLTQFVIWGNRCANNLRMLQ